MNDIKTRLLSNWNVWRITRLVFSLVFIINGILTTDYILLISGVFLLVHALVNMCATCVTNNCEIPQKK